MINYSYYKNDNSSNTLLLLHGWGVDSSYMESLKDFLLNDYSILILDLPGHGKSYLDKAYTINDYIDEIFMIVCKENITRLYGIGHSFGGKVLSYYSLKYPLLGGILISPSTIKPPFSLVKFLKIRLYKIFKFLRIPLPKFLQGSRDYKLTTGLKRKTFLNVSSSYLSKKELSQIRCNMLIIGFNNDLEVKIKSLKKLDKYIPNSKLFIYEGDHFSYFSYFKEIRILLNFLLRRE